MKKDINNSAHNYHSNYNYMDFKLLKGTKNNRCTSDSESNEYIYYFLTTLQRHLDSKATMAAQKNINLRVLSDIEIPLPDLNEQNRIVTHLDDLSERTRSLETATQEKLNDLTSFKASLLDAAFKGQP